MVVAGVVGESVVEAAEEDSVGEVGLAAGLPGVPVVCFGPGGWSVAGFGAAAAVSDGHQHGLGFGEQSGFPAAVDRDARGAVEDGDDGGVAGQPADLLGTEPVTVAEPGRTQRRGKDVVVQADEQGDRDPAVAGRASTGRCSMSSQNPWPSRVG